MDLIKMYDSSFLKYWWGRGTCEELWKFDKKKYDFFKELALHFLGKQHLSIYEIYIMHQQLQKMLIEW